jgi:hypothetical protein
VGVITWAIDQPIASAYIEFGRDPEVPEYFAPVDLNEPDLRTLLLGMKSAGTYTYRIVSRGCAGEVYVSPDTTLVAGFLPNAMPPVTVQPKDATGLYAGFTLSCNGYGNFQNLERPGASSWAFILDKDGDYVWSLELADSAVPDCSRIRMSHDGKHMWLGNTSTTKPNGALVRMKMDGSEEQVFSLPARHHDFTVLPGGNILYFEQQNGGGVFDETEGPDSIMELDPATGQSSLIYDQTVDFSDIIDANAGAHTNGITYVSHLNAFSFSMLYPDTIALLSYPDAQILGVFSGQKDEFGVSWDAQHGHEFLPSSLLVFNNWSDVGDSALLEFPYDLTTKTLGERSVYAPDPEISTIAFGAVQRLPNENTLVTFSSNGVVHEIDSNKQLLQETVIDAVLGYATRRATLYGPPPHLP